MLVMATAVLERNDHRSLLPRLFAFPHSLVIKYDITPLVINDNLYLPLFKKLVVDILDGISTST